MLRTNVVVAQLQGLTQAQLEDALGARGEGNVALDRLLALADDLDDGGAHGLALDLHGLQGLGGDAFTLGDQAEQQVLRADVVVLETASLVLREHDDPASAVGKAFEHASPHFTGQALRRARRTPVPVDWLQPTESGGAVRALSPWAQGRGRGRSVARGRGEAATPGQGRGHGRSAARTIGMYLWEPHPKVACNSTTRTFRHAHKRWNCNGHISTLERLPWELRARFLGNAPVATHNRGQFISTRDITETQPNREHYTS